MNIKRNVKCITWIMTTVGTLLLFLAVSTIPGRADLLTNSTNKPINSVETLANTSPIKTVNVSQSDTVEGVDYSFDADTGLLKIGPGTISTKPNSYPWRQFDVKKVEIVGDLKLENDAPKEFFYGLKDLKSIENLNHLDVSAATSLNSMFWGCDSLGAGSDHTIDLSNFDTGKVTDMSWMFAYCFNLYSLDLNFDTHNVITMASMFFDDEFLSSVDVSSFDTRQVSDMSSMFAQIDSMNQLDVSNFKTHNVTTMAGMFNENLLLRVLDLSNFYTDKVTDMSYMFDGDQNLLTLKLPHFNMSNTTKMTGLLGNNTELRLLTLGPDVKLTPDCGLGAPYEKDNWQAVGDGNQFYPDGTVYSPSELIALYATNPGFEETYVPENTDDYSTINTKSIIKLPVGAKLTPADVFNSMTTNYGVNISSYSEALEKGLKVNDSEVDTSKTGIYYLIFSYRGVHSVTKVVVGSGN